MWIHTHTYIVRSASRPQNSVLRVCRAAGPETCRPQEPRKGDAVASPGVPGVAKGSKTGLPPPCRDVGEREAGSAAGEEGEGSSSLPTRLPLPLRRMGIGQTRAHRLARGQACMGPAISAPPRTLSPDLSTMYFCPVRGKCVRVQEAVGGRIRVTTLPYQFHSGRKPAKYGSNPDEGRWNLHGGHRHTNSPLPSTHE